MIKQRLSSVPYSSGEVLITKGTSQFTPPEQQEPEIREVNTSANPAFSGADSIQFHPFMATDPRASEHSVESSVRAGTRERMPVLPPNLMLVGGILVLTSFLFFLKTTK